MGIGVLILIGITLLSAALLLTASLGMVIVHPWLLLLVLAVCLLCYWRHRVNDRARRVARWDAEQIGLAIMAEAREHREEVRGAVEYAKRNPTARRRPGVIPGHEQGSGHEPTFRPWAGW
jgi:hypothetical protein